MFFIAHLRPRALHGLMLNFSYSSPGLISNAVTTIGDRRRWRCNDLKLFFVSRFGEAVFDENADAWGVGYMTIRR
jgi:hypothetical protein